MSIESEVATTGGDAAAPAIGVYGKVRSQPDFLRANAGEFSQAGLDRWFQDAVEIIRTEKTALPPGPTGFVLTPSASRQTFVGAFVPGVDAAGRTFPLSVFLTIPATAAVDALPTLPAIYGRFVDAAGAIAMAGAELSGPDLVAHAQALSIDAPAPPAVADADGAVAALGSENAQILASSMGGARPALAYALRTCAMACDQAAKTGPAGQGGVITIDAPAPSNGARTLWLELVRRRLKWRDAAPSLLWTGPDSGRLLVTLGHPAPTSLAYLANPRHRAPRFWPLRTDVGAAIESALKALTPEQRRLVENPASTLAELLAAFG
ncbi:MAG TPA: type VI secretion system-associated protein TagF [Polyangia bacterium]|jgi:type VI secretion system ImpM family protein|nr:type VI secretion system-associated protein TagF [Polyangia bacterium]